MAVFRGTSNVVWKCRLRKGFPEEVMLELKLKKKKSK